MARISSRMAFFSWKLRVRHLAPHAQQQVAVGLGRHALAVLHLVVEVEAGVRGFLGPPGLDHLPDLFGASLPRAPGG